MAVDGMIKAPSNKERGFSLLEFMLAMMILFIGLLGISGVITVGVVKAMQSKEQTMANQLAREAIEAVSTARFLGTLQFNQVRNVSQGGVFLDGYQPIKTGGKDGLIGTSDDGVPLTYTDPGPDNIYGTADDKITTFDNFQRQIVITDLDAFLRSVTVNVRYTLNGLTWVTTMNTLISNVN